MHDPPSKRETFEITTFENGNFEIVYFTREKKESGGGAPLVTKEFFGSENALNVEVEFESECKNCGDECACKGNCEDDKNNNEPRT